VVDAEPVAGAYDDVDRFPEHGCYGRAKVVSNWIPPGTATLLDAGCAYGYGTRFFARKAGRTFGIDPNAQLIEVARRRYTTIEFAVSGVESMHFEAECFDVIVMADVLEHVRDERRTLDEVFPLLTPGGHFIITVPNRGAFSFLDLDNMVLRLRNFAPQIYDVIYRVKEGRARGAKPGYDDWHRHYSKADIERKLESSAFGGHFAIVESRRWGLLIEPVMDLVINLTRLVLGIERARRFAPLFERIQAIEDRVRCGRFSYNLGLLVRKVR
jgi:SAM-dependent methyltransferase